LRQLGVPIHLRAGQVAIDENDTEIDLRELLHGPIDRGELVRIGIQPFLPGYRPHLGDAFRAWVEDLRDRAASVRRRALAAAIVDARAKARFSEIHALARSLLALDPLNETATLALAEALVMDGSKVDAVQLLERYEAEVGEVSEALRIPARTLRRRVSEGMDDALLPLRFEVPFVGRIPEFGELRDAWVGARRGAGQCVMVTGEPGIGKTRTSTELARLAVLDGGLVVTYTCSAGDTMAPLSSLLGLTAALLGQPGALGCGHEHLSYLRRLIHPDPQQPLASGLTADLAYAQLVYSLSELVAAISEEAPLVIFIDDAHKLHQTSWRIFTDVTHRTPESAVLLLLATRQVPEFYPTLGITGSDGRMRHVRLRPFGLSDSHEFLGRWSERNQVSLDDSVVERFSQTAAGNPFYLGELAAHRGRGGPDDVPPATIRGLIELQFAGLRDHAQRVLLVVSLLQAHATLERVAQVLELTPMDFLAALEELEIAGLVGARGTSLIMRHDVVAELTQSGTASSVLSFLLTRCAQAAALAYSDPDILAHAVRLFSLAGDRENEASTLLALGAQLIARGLTTDAEVALHSSLARTNRATTTAEALLLLRRAVAAASEWSRLAALPPCNTTLLSNVESLDCALMDATAAYWSFGTLPDSRSLEQIITDAGLPTDLRARAAQLALTAWDNGDCELPLSPPHARFVDYAKDFAGHGHPIPDLILRTRAGDRDAVLAFSDRLPGRREATPTQRLVHVRNAAHALIRIGEPIRARTALLDGLAEARRLALPSHEGVFLALAARLTSHADDWHSQRELEHAIASTTQAPPEDFTSRYRFLAAAAMLSSIGNEDQVLSILETLENTPASELAADSDSYWAARCTLFAAARRRPTGPMIEWVRHRGLRTIARGGFDHLAHALVELLHRNDAKGEAMTLQQQYLTVCRELGTTANSRRHGALAIDLG
jgi:hypothetical protein